MFRRRRNEGRSDSAGQLPAAEHLDRTKAGFLDVPTEEAANRYLEDHPDERSLVNLLLVYLAFLDATGAADEDTAARARRRLTLLAGSTDIEVIISAVRLEHLSSSLGLGMAETTDVERAFELLDRTDSIALADALHPALGCQVYDSMSIVKGALYQRTEQLDLLESGRADAERAVELTEQSSDALAGRLNNLSNYYAMLHDRTGEQELLDRSIERSRRALRITPESHQALPNHLTGLAIRLRLSHEASGNTSQLLEALDLAKRAVELTPKDDPQGGNRVALWLELRDALQPRSG